MVQVLIDAGADIHSTNDKNETVLHVAAKSKEPGMIPCLLAVGAGCYLNSNATSAQGVPLMVACQYGNTAGVKHLLEAGAEVRARTHIMRLLSSSLLRVLMRVRLTWGLWSMAGMPPLTS